MDRKLSKKEFKFIQRFGLSADEDTMFSEIQSIFKNIPINERNQNFQPSDANIPSELNSKTAPHSSANTPVIQPIVSSSVVTQSSESIPNIQPIGTSNVTTKSSENIQSTFDTCYVIVRK